MITDSDSDDHLLHHEEHQPFRWVTSLFHDFHPSPTSRGTNSDGWWSRTIAFQLSSKPFRWFPSKPFITRYSLWRKMKSHYSPFGDFASLVQDFHPSRTALNGWWNRAAESCGVSFAGYDVVVPIFVWILNSRILFFILRCFFSKICKRILQFCCC